MTVEILPLHKDAQGRNATKPIARHNAVRRLVTAARANGLSLAVAVTEENVTLVAELNLFPEYEVSSQAPTILAFQSPEESPRLAVPQKP